MRTLKQFVVAMAVVLAWSTGAAATTLSVGGSISYTYDGATSSPVCTLCDATSTLSFIDANTIRIDLANTSTDGVTAVNKLTGVGYDTVPLIDLTGATFFFFGDMATGWEVVDNGGGLGGFNLISDSTLGNIYLDDGQSGYVVIHLASSLGSFDVNGTAVHFQTINDVNGTSTKPPGTCVDCNGTDGSDGENETPVPEPGSLMLLGSGLVFAATRLRRNRAR
jgi:hypothetical protein